MPDAVACGHCEASAIQVASRVCEHMLDGFMTTYFPEEPGAGGGELSCAACDTASSQADVPVCASCHAHILAVSVPCTEDDAKRGYAIADRKTSHTAREIFRPQLLAVGVGDFVKLSFCQVPVVAPRFIEHMWLEVTARVDDRVVGTLANEPGVFDSDVLATGDVVECEIGQVIHTAVAPGYLSQLDVEHSCELCSEDKRSGEIDRSDAQLLSNVRQHGWHALHVADTADTPTDEVRAGFTYSVGLAHSFDLPELIIFGLEHEVAHVIISRLIAMSRSGTQLEPDVDYTGIIEGHPVQLHGFGDRASYEEHLGYAIWFYRRPFPAAQIVWPDSEGNFPWDEEFDPALTDAQPVLA